jgi:hypothetical protein
MVGKAMTVMEAVSAAKGPSSPPGRVRWVRRVSRVSRVKRVSRVGVLAGLAAYIGFTGSAGHLNLLRSMLRGAAYCLNLSGVEWSERTVPPIVPMPTSSAPPSRVAMSRRFR